MENQIENVTELVGLSGELKKMVNAYSGGMKQRLSLATTLLAKPSVLILDEPTVGIDPLLRKKIWEALYQLREGHLLISGTPNEIQLKSGCNNMVDAFIHYSIDRSEIL